MELGLYLMAAIYIGAGFTHFLKPKLFLAIMPPYLPFHRAAVFLSGMVEVACGALLISPTTREYGAWGIIGLLVAVFPANLYMHQERHGKFKQMPGWVLFSRLPIQALLIFWAYLYT